LLPSENSFNPLNIIPYPVQCHHNQPQLNGSGLPFFESFFKKWQIVPCDLITRITREVPVAEGARLTKVNDSESLVETDNLNHPVNDSTSLRRMRQ
jgi:hypothetical protein